MARKISSKIGGMMVAALMGGAIIPAVRMQAEDLVILHTNDTHSSIDPDANGEGGVLPRKAIIDSVRKAEKNVLLVDAGDVVQGTLYFKFFRGDVEYPLMNMMGYDVQILGNHEFDNGLEELAAHYATLKADRLSANYDFTGTPMEGLMQPYSIKEVGGKRVGFIGINLDPASIISAPNYEGMEFEDVITTANAAASKLRNELGCDLVVVVSHIGAKKENPKTIDYELARASKDIDLIIGGHSHTIILPENGSAPEYPSLVENAEGRPVMVAQTGRYGKYLGYVKINLDSLAEQTPANFEQRLIHVTDRFPASQLDNDMEAFIAPYREKLKDIDRHVIARTLHAMDANDNRGSYVNWSADFAKWYGSLKADSLQRAGVDFPNVDFAMMNVGGIRHSAPEGDFTEGQLLSTFPFANRMVIERIKGKDFIEAMRVAASKGGESVSNEIRVLTDGGGELRRVIAGDAEMDPEKDYIFCTIDYLANGNDDFVSLANGEVIWTDDVEMSAPMMRYLTHLTQLGLPVDGDPRPRFMQEVVIPSDPSPQN